MIRDHKYNAAVREIFSVLVLEAKAFQGTDSSYVIENIPRLHYKDLSINTVYGIKFSLLR
jgi:hypothetical protein